MSKRKEPMERQTLKHYKNEKQYYKNLEFVIIEEGKRLLNALPKRYIIVSEDNLEKYIKRFPEIKTGNVIFHQLGFGNLYGTKQLSNREYRLLMCMKQALNKNGMYILWPDTFDNLKIIRDCGYFKKLRKRDICKNESCKASRNCMKFYKYNIKEEKDA